MEVQEYLKILMPPMGLAYIAAVLEGAGHEVGIIDVPATCIGPAELKARLGKENPDIVGTTAVTPTIYGAMAAMGIAKESCPDAFTVMGGAHPTFLPTETLKGCPQLDAVCVGEGERTMLNLTKALESGGGLATVTGICYRNGDSIARNPPTPLITNLDELPFPARHLLLMDKYGNQIRWAADWSKITSTFGGG